MFGIFKLFSLETRLFKDGVRVATQHEQQGWNIDKGPTRTVLKARSPLFLLYGPCDIRLYAYAKSMSQNAYCLHDLDHVNPHFECLCKQYVA